ncbi:MAG: hypothetical protein ACI9NT_000110 [Bacteroidia bacterium]|jgi:hypothetical protein
MPQGVDLERYPTPPPRSLLGLRPLGKFQEGMHQIIGDPAGIDDGCWYSWPDSCNLGQLSCQYF